MWFSRRLVLAAALAALAGCGFTPVYGPQGVGTRLHGLLLADEPGNRNQFTFVARFEERLGRATAPRYRLAYAIGTREKAVGVTPEQETTRYNLFGSVDYTVYALGTDRVLAQGKVENFTGYSATSLTVSSRSVTSDANERLMNALADQIVARLIATAPDWLE